MIVGEIKTFAICWSNYVVWSNYNWVLHRFDMSQGYPSNGCLKNLNDWICAYLFGATISKRDTMVDQVNKQFLGVRGRRYNIHAMKGESPSVVEICSRQAGDLWGCRIIRCNVILIGSTRCIQRTYSRKPVGPTVRGGTSKVNYTSRLVEYDFYKTSQQLFCSRGVEFVYRLSQAFSTDIVSQSWFPCCSIIRVGL